MEASSDPTPPLALDDIQGNLAGFMKPLQSFVLLRFASKDTAQSFLHAVRREIDSAAAVVAFKKRFKWHQKRGHTELPQSEWFNLLLTAAGLLLLEAPGIDQLESAFSEGMRARSQTIGDTDFNAPEHWDPAFAGEFHALAILATDTPEDLERWKQTLARHCHAHEVETIATLDGSNRPGAEAGHEHFGFRDGASQPGVHGLTEDPRPGQEVLPAGEFILGPLRQGDPGAPPPSSGYPPVAPPPQPALPPWAVNGSYVVFRRLSQDVAAFNAFIAEEAPKVGLRPDLLEAKLVGRYKSGAPLEHLPSEPPDLDPQAADPAQQDASWATDDQKNNDFAYQAADPDGHLVPRAAHIRKAYPRDEEPPGKPEIERHRILRRGIPYGPELVEGEPPYPGQEAPPDNQDRGLLFLCYQASIERQFEFIQARWINDPGFPQPDDGRDPIVSQDVETPEFSLPPDHRLTLARWVRTTGGEYLFSPSLSGLKQLSGH